MSKNYSQIECPICGTPFLKEQKHINEAAKKGWVSTCSSDCQKKARDNRVECICLHCKEPFLRLPSRIVEGKVYCSRSCARKGNTT